MDACRLRSIAVVLVIANSSQLDQLGWNVLRRFEIDGEQLVLSGSPIGDLLGFRIRWKRLK